MLTRRVFLRGSSIAMVGMGHAPMWLARAAASEGHNRKTLVAIFLRGAADGLNIVVPFGDPRYRELRPTLGLQPPQPQDAGQNNGPFGAVIDLDGKFGLHPGLRPFKELWDKRQLAIVEAAGSPDPSRSHFDAQDYMESGTPGKTGNGWLNRALGEPAADASPLRAGRSRFPIGFRARSVESMRRLRSVTCRTSTFPIRNAWPFSKTCTRSLRMRPCAGPARTHSRP